MKRLTRIISIVSLVCLVFGAGYLMGTTHSTPAVLAQGGGQPADTQTLFQPFWESWSLIQDNFVDIDKTTNTKLMEAALSGMVDSLGDEHSGYSNPAEWKSLLSGMTGQYEGIGASVRKDTTTGGVLIVSTMDGSPARQALQQGDVIITVDGKDITKLSLDASVNLIRGPRGTKVTVGVLRKGNTKLVEITLTRASIQQQIVTSALYQGNIGYIKLAEFTPDSTTLMSKAIRTLKANTLNGLILDLRSNPGGGRDNAVDIASLFLDGGTVTIQKGRSGTQDEVFLTTGQALAPTVPLVVLVNESSASASELVSGALQDRGRSTIIGTRSFGKGSVQRWQPLSNGGGLRITIARFFKPSGASIDHIGISPDLYVPWSEVQARANPDYDPQLATAIHWLRGEM